MKLLDLTQQRLFNQQISKEQSSSAKEMVEWMGAMQAQDYQMSKWALGARLHNSTDKSIEEEFNNGYVLRTHLMRPTWHLVSSADIYWMLNLTAPQINTLSKSRHRDLGLSADVVAKCLKLIEKALEKENHLTREELVTLFLEAKIGNDNNRISHIMICAEMEGLVCSGPVKKGKTSYALLEQRVPKKNLLSKEESVALLALKYFQSHGPATLKDFVWWSGLSVANGRLGIELNKKDLEKLKIDDEIYWGTSKKAKIVIKPLSVYLLPAFDEYLIAYRNRNAIITEEDTRKAISSNGIFRPTIVVNGEVSGIWKREIKKNKVIVSIDLFKGFDEDLLLVLKEKVGRYGEFLGLNAEVKLEKIKLLR